MFTLQLHPNMVAPSLHFNSHFSRWTGVSRPQNVYILDFIGANDDGGTRKSLDGNYARNLVCRQMLAAFV